MQQPLPILASMTAVSNAQFIPGGWCLYRKILPSKYKVVYIVLRRTAGSGYCSVAISEGSVMENPDPEGAGLWIVDRDSSAGILLKGWEFEEHQSTIPIPFLKILHFHNGQNAPQKWSQHDLNIFFPAKIFHVRNLSHAMPWQIEAVRVRVPPDCMAIQVGECTQAGCLDLRPEFFCRSRWINVTLW